MLGMLSEARVILEEEVRRTVRRKSYVLIMLSIPALLLLLLVAVPVIRNIVESEDEEPKPTGIVNLSDSLTLDTEAFPGVLALAGREEGLEALTEDNIKELFLIPQDYLASGTVEWIHTRSGTGPGDSIAATVITMLRVALAEEDLPPEVLARAIAGTAFEGARLGPDGLPLDEDIEALLGTIIVTAVFAMLMMFGIMVGAGALLRSVAEEKETRMMEVLLTSARPFSVMAAKVLALGACGLAVIVVWGISIMVIAPRIVDTIADAPELGVEAMTLVWVGAFFLAGYLHSAVILAGIGAMSTGVKEANQAAMLVLGPLIAPVYALGVILANADGALARTLSLFPFTAPVTMMLRLSFGEPPVLEILASLALMTLSGLALLWVSARIFRAGSLMYGQRMSLRRAFSALREAG